VQEKYYSIYPHEKKHKHITYFIFKENVDIEHTKKTLNRLKYATTVLPNQN